MSTDNTIGRNDPCPCGSGKKYKKCCLASDLEKQREEDRLAREAAKSAKGGGLFDEPDDPEPYEDDDEEEEEYEPTELDQLWDEFLALKNPVFGDVEPYLAKYLSLLPDEGYDPGEAFRKCKRWPRVDMVEVFRAITSQAAHVRENRMGFFYWGAAEYFLEKKDLGHDMVGEIVDGMCKLDVESYDPDALIQCGYTLLDAGYTGEVLRLTEHFLPIIKGCGRVMAYVGSEQADFLLLLRTGQMLQASQQEDGLTKEECAAHVCRGFGSEIHEDIAMASAKVISGEIPREWSQESFGIPKGDITEDDQAWAENVRHFTSRVCAAQEAWLIDGQDPARLLPGFDWMVEMAFHWNRYEAGKLPKTRINNLLDCLKKNKMEERIASYCQALMGTNVPQSRVVLGAHQALCNFAHRHGLVTEKEAKESNKEIARLLKKLHH